MFYLALVGLLATACVPSVPGPAETNTKANINKREPSISGDATRSVGVSEQACVDEIEDWTVAGVPNDDADIEWADLSFVSVELNQASVTVEITLRSEPDFREVEPAHELAIGVNFADRSQLVLRPDLTTGEWGARWSRGGFAHQTPPVASLGPVLRVTMDDPSPPVGVPWSAFTDFRSRGAGRVGAVVADECDPWR